MNAAAQMSLEQINQIVSDDDHDDSAMFWAGTGGLGLLSTSPLPAENFTQRPILVFGERPATMGAKTK